ncbi:MAG: hypothetical protein P1U54_10010, partial [Immundisolibacteraceae bacterium]|nr:hypothetical protein [Immundisolibacteraceae bacterium]
MTKTRNSVPVLPLALLAAITFLVKPLTVQAADVTCSWLSGSGNWTDTANWAANCSGLFPQNDLTNTFDVNKTAAGTATLDQDIIINNLLFTSGTIDGVGDLDIRDDFTFGTATMGGSGRTQVFGNMFFNASTSAFADARVLEIASGALGEWSAGTITLANLANELNIATGATLNVIGASKFMNGSGLLDNDGILNINATAGQTITVDVDLDNSGSIAVGTGTLRISEPGINSGTVSVNQAGATLEFLSSNNFDSTGGAIDINAGTLRVQSSTLDGGTITVAAGANAELSTGTVRGGTVNNSGVIATTSGTSRLSGNVNTAVGGQINVGNATGLIIDGNGVYSNDGTINLQAVSTTSLFIDGTATLSGSGKLVSNADTSNRILGLVANSDTLINDTNHSIEMAGALGNNFLMLENRGAIRANTGGLLTIDVTGTNTSVTPGMINSGLVEVTAGNEIAINGSRVQNFNGGNAGLVDVETGATLDMDTSSLEGGQVDVASGGTVELGSSTIQSGSVNNNGVIVSNSGTSRLSGNVNTAVGGQINVGNATGLIIDGNGVYSNDGTINLQAVSTTSLFIDGTATLSGSGKLVSNADTSNRILGLVANSDTLINDTNHSIEMAGALGNNFLILENRGAIRANTGGLLTIDVTGTQSSATPGLINSGLVSAQGSANGADPLQALVIINSRVENSGGIIEADGGGAGAEVRLSNTRIDGGELISTNGGLIRNDSGTVVLDNVVLTSGSRFE